MQGGEIRMRCKSMIRFEFEILILMAFLHASNAVIQYIVLWKMAIWILEIWFWYVLIGGIPLLFLHIFGNFDVAPPSLHNETGELAQVPRCWWCVELKSPRHWQGRRCWWCHHCHIWSCKKNQDIVAVNLKLSHACIYAVLSACMYVCLSADLLHIYDHLRLDRNIDTDTWCARLTVQLFFCTQTREQEQTWTIHWVLVRQCCYCPGCRSTTMVTIYLWL